MVGGVLRKRIGLPLCRLSGRLEEAAEHDGEKHEISGAYAHEGQRCVRQEASTPA